MKRIKTSAKWVALCLLGLLAIQGVATVYYGRQVEQKLNQLHRIGMPVTRTEIIPRLPAHAKNAAPLYQKSFSLLPPELSNRKLRTLAGPSFTAQSLKDAKGILAECDQAMAVAQKASAIPDAVFPVNWSDTPGYLLPHLANLRKLCTLFTIRALVFSSAGHSDMAVESLVIALRIARVPHNEPCFISALMQSKMLETAMQALETVLSSQTPSYPTMKALDAELSKVDATLMMSFKIAFQGELTAGIEYFNIARTHGLNVTENKTEPQMIRPTRPLIYMDELNYIDAMVDLSKRISYPRRLMPAAKVDDPTDKWYASVSKLLFPYFFNATLTRDSLIARAGLERTALALKLHRKQSGKFPPSLDSVKTVSGTSLPQDVFSGRSFGYIAGRRSIHIYSVGPDLTDNQGKALKGDVNLPGVGDLVISMTTESSLSH